MVSDNVDEVEYYSNKEDANPDGDRDIYIRYKNGYLEIDDDYLDQMNGIYTTLYKEDYELLYGENPIAQATGDVAFADHKLQTLRYKGTTYYVYDRSLKGEGMEDLWLRGIVSRSQGARWMDAAGTFRRIFSGRTVSASNSTNDTGSLRNSAGAGFKEAD